MFASRKYNGFSRKEEYPLDQGRDVTGIWTDLHNKKNSNLYSFANKIRTTIPK